MKTKSIMSISTSILLCGLVFSGCGGGSDSSTPTGTTGTLVDPYISGAILCQDTNGNGTCETDEPTSSATTSEGVFTFTNKLTAGKNIIIKTQGIHEGKTFDLNISGVVSEDGSIDVVSPLTTFQSRGLTANQIANILTKAKTDAIADGAINLGSFTVSATTILNNPLDGALMDKKVSQISDADLVNIQSSLVAYGLLKVMNGSSTLASLSGVTLETSGTTTGSPVNLIARKMLQSVSDGLNTALLTTIKNSIDTGRTALTTGLTSGGAPNAAALANTALPEPTIGLVIKVAVKLIDDIAQTGYTTCNATSGDDTAKVTAALSAVATRANTIATGPKIMELGTKLYGLTYKSTITNTLSGVYSAGLTGLASTSPDMAIGFNSNSNVKTFVFDTTGSIVYHTN